MSVSRCNVSDKLVEAGYHKGLVGEDFIAENASDEKLIDFLKVVMGCVDCPSTSLGYNGCGYAEDVIEDAVFRGLTAEDPGIMEHLDKYNIRRVSLPKAED